MITIDTYSGLSSGGLDWTKAFQAATSRLREKGGGILCVPQGRYPTRSIRLFSDITLVVEAGAVLFFLDDFERYETIQWKEAASPAYMPCLYARDARNIRVTGDGVIDGNGARWWEAAQRRDTRFAAPPLVGFDGCARMGLDGVMLRDAPAEGMRLRECTDVTVRGVAMALPRDGIVAYESRHVRVLDSHIDAGGSAVVLRTGGFAQVSRCSMLRGGIDACGPLSGPVILSDLMMDGVARPIAADEGSPWVFARDVQGG